MWKRLGETWVVGEGQFVTYKDKRSYWLFRGLVAGRRAGWVLMAFSVKKGWRAMAEWGHCCEQARPPVWLDPWEPIAYKIVRKAQDKSCELEWKAGMHWYETPGGVTYFNDPFCEIIMRWAVILDNGKLGIETRDESGNVQVETIA